MVSLKYGSGEWVDNPCLVRGIIDNHFIDLFTSTGHRDWGSILECITPKVIDKMNDTLTTLVSVDEIKDAALQIGGLKAPSPDGFQGNLLPLLLGYYSEGCE